MTMQSDDFPGYESLRLHFADLMDSPFDPPSVATALLAAGIVGKQVLFQAKQLTVDEGMRRTNIVSAVQANGAPRVFQSFVEILRKNPANHAICGKLKATYKKQGGVWLDKETRDSRAAPSTATHSVALDGDEATDESIIETPSFKLTRYIKEKHQPLRSQQGKKGALKKFAKKVHLVIQTCNDAEYYAVLERLKHPRIQEFDEPVEYPHSELTIVVGTFAKIDAAVIRTKQGAKCREELEAVFKNIFTNAKLLLGLGVCYGLKNNLAKHDLKFADVLVGEKIDAVLTPKLKSDGTMDPRGEDKVAPKSVQKLFCEDPDMWRKFNVCQEPSERFARAFVGCLASMSILINNPNVIQGLEKSSEQYLGGEMEGWAQIEYVPDGVKCIIIKGIADFANGSKDKVWQLTAAMAAVDYAHYKLVKRGIHFDEKSDQTSQFWIITIIIIMSFIFVPVVSVLLYYYYM